MNDLMPGLATLDRNSVRFFHKMTDSNASCIGGGLLALHFLVNLYPNSTINFKEWIGEHGAQRFEIYVVFRDGKGELAPLFIRNKHIRLLNENDPLREECSGGWDSAHLGLDGAGDIPYVMIHHLFPRLFVETILIDHGTCASCGVDIVEEHSIGQWTSADRGLFEYEQEFRDKWERCREEQGLPQNLCSSCVASIKEDINTIIASEEEDGFVYGYYAQEINMIKIGKGRNVESRRSYSANQSPVPIELYFYGNGYSNTERWMHRRFYKQRRNGEWFVFDNELRDFIYQSGAFVVSDMYKEAPICSSGS